MTTSVEFVPVVGRTATGETVWYTGKAGAAFVSANPAEAYQGYTLESARRRARMLNQGTPLHGIWFVAAVGDIAQEVR